MARSVGILAVSVVAALTAAAPAAADTFVVTKRGDPVPDACRKRDCSLREAVLAASTHPGRDVIDLPNSRKPYRLERVGSNESAGMTGDLDISNHRLVIRHRGKGRATIDGGGLDRVFEVFAPTTFRKLAVTGGRVPVLATASSGGGIRADADLKVVRSRIAGNMTTTFGGGIELARGAGLQLIDGVVARNQAGRAGGAIDDASGPITIVRSRIAGNTAVNGGGLYLESATTARIVNSTISGNEASNGVGGGVSVSRPGPPLRIKGTTISGNRAEDNGGGVFAFSSLTLTNSTVASNRSNETGGGIAAADSETDVTLNAVTVARNAADANGDGSGTGGGLFRFLTASFEVENSLVALNRLGSGARNDCDGNQPFDSLGHNLVSRLGPPAMTASGVTCEGFDRPTDLVGLTPRIGKLKRNGGPTQTIALRKRSGAINKAKRSTAPRRDQRGERRGRKKDIGAFERKTAR
jgi:CSLREA domain-containing protein